MVMIKVMMKILMIYNGYDYGCDYDNDNDNDYDYVYVYVYVTHTLLWGVFFDVTNHLNSSFQPHPSPLNVDLAVALASGGWTIATALRGTPHKEAWNATETSQPRGIALMALLAETCLPGLLPPTDARHTHRAGSKVRSQPDAINWSAVKSVFTGVGTRVDGAREFKWETVAFTASTNSARPLSAPSDTAVTDNEVSNFERIWQSEVIFFS